MQSAPVRSLSRQSLLKVLESVPDPRARRGVRHRVVTVLALAVVAVLAGARTCAAVWEHAAHMSPEDLEALGVPAGRALPSESTIRRVLAAIDPGALDRLITTWMYVRTGVRQGRRVIAVDGRTMPGTRPGGQDSGRAPHLLAALHQATGTVVAQEAVGAGNNEIPALRELLADTESLSSFLCKRLGLTGEG